MFPIYQVIFFVFAAILIAAAVMVIVVRNPVHSILFLVLAFFASAVLWMMMQAEFLALVLIFVYVGAVMTLFLFVVMMLNIDLSKVREKFVHYLPVSILVMLLLIASMIMVILPKHLGIAAAQLTPVPSDFSNVAAMGVTLYTHFLYPFEIAAVILLVAIIAAITLAFHGRKPNTKSQRVMQQLKANKADRLRIIKMKADKP
jgi:NADH-quinone oxidoreductase subunit J